MIETQLTGDIHEFHLGSVNVRLIAEGDRVVVHARTPAGFEPTALEAWQRLCEGGGTVIDVGAYTGLYSMIAALNGCRTLAFEPMPSNAERLRANARLNGVTVELTEAALSDRAGAAEIYYSPKTRLTSGASLVPGRPMGFFRRSKKRALRVPTLTIDSLELEELTAVKIDAERSEPLVLKGARQTIARLKPAIVAEALGDDERSLLMREIPDYRVAEQLDRRNLLLLPA